MKSTIIFTLIVFLCLSNSIGQSTDNDTETEDFVFPDVEPRPLNMGEVQKLIGYPDEARQKRIQGTVVLRVLVGESGNYIEHVVIQDSPPTLVNGVEKHIAKLKFSPATLNGENIKFWVNIPFAFKLFDNTPNRKENSKLVENTSNPKVYRAADDDPYRKGKRYNKNPRRIPKTAYIILSAISIILGIIAFR